MRDVSTAKTVPKPRCGGGCVVSSLVDVSPDGSTRNVCDGIRRLRFAASVSKAQWVKSGSVAELTIDLGPTRNTFLAGKPLASLTIPLLQPIDRVLDRKHTIECIRGAAEEITARVGGIGSPSSR